MYGTAPVTRMTGIPLQGRVQAHVLDYLTAVHPRHAQIKEDQVYRWGLSHLPEGGYSIERRHNLVSLVTQDLTQDHHNGRFIVDDQILAKA